MSKRNKLYTTLGILLITISVISVLFQKVLWAVFPPGGSPIVIIMFGLPIGGFVLGAIVNIFPQRGTTYKERYLNTALVTTIVYGCIFLLPLLVIIFKAYF